MAFDFKSEHVRISSDVAVTLIGADTKFKGNITTHTPIHIDGYFEGIIDSDDIVEISTVGSFKGTINCKTLYLEGTGDGDIHCTDLMEFTKTGIFTGSLSTADLVIVEGALLDGTCTMKSIRAAK